MLLVKSGLAAPTSKLRRQDDVTFAIEYPFDQQKLRFTRDGTFQISVFNDLHYGEGMSSHDFLTSEDRDTYNPAFHRRILY